MAATPSEHAHPKPFFKHPLINAITADAVQRGVPEAIRGQFVQQRYRLAFSISATLESLTGLTPDTRFIWLDAVDMDSLLPTAPDSSSSSLITRLDQALLSLPGASQHGAFIKLDSRSPKDAACGSTDDTALVEEVIRCITRDARINETGATAETRISAQNALDGLMIALQSKLCVHNGAEAVALLKKSWRVREDLQTVRPLLDWGVRTCIVLRTWDAQMANAPQGEFRAFVVNNRLTACSQYDHLCFFPQIASRRAEITAAIQSFFDEQLRERLTRIDSYIVDLFIDVDGIASGSKPVIRVVELNSFESWTGACLFSWTTDRDVLLGEKPFEFRCVTQPAPDKQLLEIIPDAWLKVIASHFVLPQPQHPVATSKPCCLQ